MSDWYSILFLILAAIVVWISFRTVRNNPAMFSKENLGRAFTVIGETVPVALLLAPPLLLSQAAV